MTDIQHYLHDFFALVEYGSVEIYNEFSLQHELGIHLRSTLGEDLKVQFERPVSFFGLEQSGFEKKEIDISIFPPDLSTKFAVELKYPRNGQYPEQMFKACQDIRFLEQLTQSGFAKCYFVIAADDPGFYHRANKTDGIYQYFRSDSPIHGIIRKPTGKKDHTFDIGGNYRVAWNNAGGDLRYAVVEIYI